MAYFADLTLYSYIRGNAKGELNIGWLDRQYPFQTGPVSDGVLDVIFELCKTPVNLTRGVHICNLCTEIKANIHERNGTKITLGGAEIRVKSKSGREYASPNMIYHYIKDHGYQPPQEFMDAVLDMVPSNYLRDDNLR
ncbi:MAG TPA: hypothetical protein VKH81_00050 [Candidatus Angelobacter sp.]|nr:hypothetical protein [Candidatus Angelobacter sp.]